MTDQTEQVYPELRGPGISLARRRADFWSLHRSHMRCEEILEVLRSHMCNPLVHRVHVMVTSEARKQALLSAVGSKCDKLIVVVTDFNGWPSAMSYAHKHLFGEIVAFLPPDISISQGFDELRYEWMRRGNKKVGCAHKVFGYHARKLNIACR